LASSLLAPGPAHAATTHSARAAIRPAPVGKELAMRPVLRRATTTSLNRPRPTNPMLARKNVLASSAYGASRTSGTRGARLSGMTHLGIDGSAVRRRK
jgi:hypothetical protein